MGLFKKKKEDVSIELEYTPRYKEIERLELERLRTNIEIEQLLKSYAKESGDRSLRKRKYKMGRGANDYGFANKK